LAGLSRFFAGKIQAGPVTALELGQFDIDLLAFQLTFAGLALA
jgi:hypothetical protein